MGEGELQLYVFSLLPAAKKGWRIWISHVVVSSWHQQQHKEFWTRSMMQILPPKKSKHITYKLLQIHVIIIDLK